ncbi:membrane protein insertion efficiency factor YidD [Candidatus Enterovibrio altilux]|uniref:membrane protein insertion efficiency factor YidD n=1 Tax=Candidatus Enterovibrio altilux TaxID=1927128 RepID=UPI000BBC1F16|nr:membrane protein insertion efficiency factor YidD [Candidatus Enterovibrio luxaltus]
MVAFISITAKKIVTALFRGYQFFISSLLGPCCRYIPTCSQYAIEAVNHHGVIKGCWFASKRLLKCHPFNHGGYDPVPLRHPNNRDN